VQRASHVVRDGALVENKNAEEGVIVLVEKAEEKGGKEVATFRNQDHLSGWMEKSFLGPRPPSILKYRSE